MGQKAVPWRHDDLGWALRRGSIGSMVLIRICVWPDSYMESGHTHNGGFAVSCRRHRLICDHALGSTYGAVVSRSMSCTCGVSNRGSASEVGCLLSEAIRASVFCAALAPMA